VAQQEQWQLSGSEPELYELYEVPRLFGPVARRLLEDVPLRAGQRVLDVACGTGLVARLAAPRVAPSGSVVGLDVSEGMLAVARAHAAEVGLAIDWQRGDAAALPFADATFDVIVCQAGLQFFSDKPAALREMHRVLARGRMVALSVFGAPSRYHVALAQALAEHVDAAVAKRVLAPFALGNPEVLDALMRDAGFGAVDIRTAVLTRRVHPSQEWLLHDTAGLPYGSAIAALDAAARAAMLREIAAELRDLWSVDGFVVPVDVQLVYAWR